MKEDKSLNEKHIFIITIIVIIILAIIALSMSQILHNDPDDLDIEPTIPDEKIYEANVTFVMSTGNISFKCDLADSNEERQIGLMNQESMEQNVGMLFVFDSPVTVSFWMKDTLIPLDIIFINSTGHVVNIEEAYPEPDVHDNLLTRYPSNGPVLYVLEINQGICAAEGIVPGTYVELEY